MFLTCAVDDTVYQNIDLFDNCGKHEKSLRISSVEGKSLYENEKIKWRKLLNWRGYVWFSNDLTMVLQFVLDQLQHVALRFQFFNLLFQY